MANDQSTHEEDREIPNALSTRAEILGFTDAPPTREEWEPRKGRKPKPVKIYPRQTPEEQVFEERKRIFIEHIQFLARRIRQDP